MNQQKNISHFLLAAPTSNAGKTTITLGLIRALKDMGNTVQPFKSGPDYIDPKFHSLASGNTSYNLDLIMMPESHIHDVYQREMSSSNVGIVEGVMGLFDGANKQKGSSAELAKQLDLPVVLVVNAKSVAYSVAPLLYGFKHFDPSVEIAGVIFNQVNTESHFQFLKDACNDVHIPCLGYVRHIPDAEIPSRHLGLSIANIEQYDSSIQKIADSIKETVDLNMLLSITKSSIQQTNQQTNQQTKETRIIAVAKDQAFNFIYPENIRQLEQHGNVVYFSPLLDQQLPENTEWIYLPGGYPECYLAELASNKSMISAIQQHSTQQKPILAECGGMMYLGKSIEDENGNAYPMVNVLPIETSMKNRKLHLGYRTIQCEEETLRAHEFHYSTSVELEPIESIGSIFNSRMKQLQTPIYKHKHILASYIHFYFGTDDQFRVLSNWMLTQ